MCLGIPMKLVEVNYPLAIAEAKGVKREVYLQLIPEDQIKPGDYVIVHVGFAIQKLSAEEAEETWQYLDQILAQENA